jgi:LysR family cys regulon transcriptional activator
MVRNQPREQTMEMLKSGELDFGCRAMATVPPGFYYKPWKTFERVLIAPKGHPALKVQRITLKELSQHAFIMPRRGSVTRQLVEQAFEQAGLRCEITLEAGGLEIIKRYVGLGLGIAVVLGFCLEPEDLKHLGTRPVKHLFGQEHYGILVKRGRLLSRASQTLIRQIDPKFPAEIP